MTQEAHRAEGNSAHRVARRVWALAEEWGPALAERVAGRHDIPASVCEELARMALAYVGVAALLVVAHAEEEPDCKRPGHPQACATEATLEKALGKIPGRLSGGCLEAAYRDVLVEALALWQASQTLSASIQAEPQDAGVTRCPVPAPASGAVPE